MNLLQFSFDIIKRFPKASVFSFLLMIMQGMISAVALVSIAPVIDLFLHPKRENLSPLTEKLIGIAENYGFPSTLLFFAFVFLAMMLAKNILLVFIRYGLLIIKYILLLELTEKTLGSFFESRWLFFTNNAHGKLVNTFLKELFRSGDAFGQLGLMVAQTYQVAIFITVPLFVSWQTTLICISVALLLASPLWLLGKLSYRLGLRRAKTDNEATGILIESMDAAKVVIGFAATQKVIRRYVDAFNAHRIVTIASQVLDEGIRRCYEPLGIVALLIAIYLADQSAFPIAETGVVIFALMRILPIIGEITATRNLLVSYLPSVEQMEHLREEAVQLKTPTGDVLFEKLNDRIRFIDVSFSYGTEKPSIRNVNIDIPRGKLIGIVGKSGSGKSTLIDLLLGLNVADQGRIEIDGIGLDQYDIESYRNRVGYVPQDPVLFNMSVRSNLLWANQEATEKELWECCIDVGAAEFIANLPMGLDTEIGNRGIRLSGGQIQRLALARALIRKPALLLLDEATSALDTESERVIQEAIEKNVGLRTIVVVAHRLSTIINSNYVYVFGEGQILEEGTYKQLLMVKGPFSKMVSAQELHGSAIEI